MISRESLHQLVDNLPESEILRAERMLQALKETAETPLYFLEDAPEDDEPETPEEASAVAEAWRERSAISNASILQLAHASSRRSPNSRRPARAT